MSRDRQLGAVDLGPDLSVRAEVSVEWDARDRPHWVPLLVLTGELAIDPVGLPLVLPDEQALNLANLLVRAYDESLALPPYRERNADDKEDNP